MHYYGTYEQAQEWAQKEAAEERESEQRMMEQIEQARQEETMTADYNSEWSYFYLRQGIEQLEKDVRKLKYLAGPEASEEQIGCLRHTIEFIEYNMKEMELMSPTETYLNVK